MSNRHGHILDPETIADNIGMALKLPLPTVINLLPNEEFFRRPARIKVCKNLPLAMSSVCTKDGVLVESGTRVVGKHLIELPYAVVEAALEADTDLESINRDIDHGLLNDVVSNSAARVLNDGVDGYQVIETATLHPAGIKTSSRKLWKDEAFSDFDFTLEADGKGHFDWGQSD